MSVADLAHWVEELCDARQHSEPIYEGRKLTHVYRTSQPGLLTQLRTWAHEGLRVEPSGPGKPGKPGSRPPGCFDALNAHVYISTEAGRWARRFDRMRETPEDNVRALVGVAPRLDEALLDRLLREVKYWRGMASAATGWTVRPYTPPVPCPVCSRPGHTLRVNIETRAGYCTNRDRDQEGDLVCGSAWPAGEADTLFAYIRSQLEA